MMTMMNVPPYISALDRSDLKRYPLEITKVPHRDSAIVAAPAAASSFSEIAAEVEAEKSTESAIQSQTTEAKPAKPFAFWQDGDFSFGDLLDIVNPLQHIPIVATLYRNMSDDKIGAVPRVIGGALWGRIGGFVSGVVNVIVDWFTGKDIGDHIYVALFGNSDASSSQTLVAKPAALEKLSTDQTALQETVPQNSFADESRYSEFLGRSKEAPVSRMSQVAHSETPVGPTNISVVSLYRQSSVANQPIADSRVRYFA
jgi:hypothetical protein